MQAAVKVALAQRKDKNIDFKLDSIVSAERQHITGFNMRLCLSMSNRGGTTELARVVLSRNTNKKWSVATWSWGSCSR